MRLVNQLPANGRSKRREMSGGKPSFPWRPYAGLMLVAATIIAYRHVLHAGFIWDDEMHVTNNPCIVGPLGLVQIWTTRAARYFPLTLTSFWVEHALWGLNPLGYHLVNVIMHCLCALALWATLRTMKVRGAWVGAALWAVHPVQVETVAWVTELKNTQSGLFFVLSVFSFIRSIATGNRTSSNRLWWYAASLISAALAMASKSSTTILPLVILLCSWWVDRRFTRDVLKALLPFVILAFASSALTVWTQHLEGANDARWTRDLAERTAVAGRIPWFYLGKLAWPHPLTFIYPRWKIDEADPLSYLPAAATLAVLIFLFRRRKGPLGPVFLAYTTFTVSLLPVLGFVDQFFWRYSFVGDHFQYLASMGPLSLAGAGIATAYGKIAMVVRGKAEALTVRVVSVAACGAVLVSLAGATTMQSTIYHDSDRLWRSTLAGNPSCWLACNNLGVEFLGRGDVSEAEEMFRRALVIMPDHVEAQNNLGNILARTGRADKAFACFEKAIALDPNFAPARFGMGDVLLHQGRLEAAAGSYRSALKLDPGNLDGQINLGAALLGEGHPAEAATVFRGILDEKPAFAWAENDLGNALFQLGVPAEAASHYRRALEIDPHLPEAANNLGFALQKLGRLDEAIAQFREAIRLKPEYREAHRNLGMALFRKGSIEEANMQLDASDGTR
jgi:protein O-mannosyl-transferase